MNFIKKYHLYFVILGCILFFLYISGNMGCESPYGKNNKEIERLRNENKTLTDEYNSLENKIKSRQDTINTLLAQRDALDVKSQDLEEKIKLLKIEIAKNKQESDKNSIYYNEKINNVKYLSNDDAIRVLTEHYKWKH